MKMTQTVDHMKQAIYAKHHGDRFLSMDIGIVLVKENLLKGTGLLDGDKVVK